MHDHFQKFLFKSPWMIFILLSTSSSIAHTSESFRVGAWEPFWSASVYVGEHKPELTQIYQNVFVAPLTFSAGEILLDTGETIEATREFKNDLEPLQGGAEFGGEFEWSFSKYFSVFAGLSSWESKEARSTSRGDVLVEKREAEALNIRTVKMSYNQAFLGTRFSLLHKPKRYRLYTRLSLNSIFDFDYFEKFVFTFDAADFPKAAGVQEVDTFKRVMITQARATAILAFQGGLGFDYYFTDQWALSFEGGYVLGSSNFALSKIDVKHNILDKDGMGEILYPVAENPEDRKGYYLTSKSFKYYLLNLNPKGWKAAITLRFAY